MMHAHSACRAQFASDPWLPCRAVVSAQLFDMRAASAAQGVGLKGNGCLQVQVVYAAENALETL